MMRVNIITDFAYVIDEYEMNVNYLSEKYYK